MIISRHIATQLNYRIAVPVRSEFLGYNNFPEVYHAQGIIKAAISAAARRVMTRVRNTTYSHESS
ncbi:hypothetical protein CWR41_00300 [Cedecea lapagei]|nr:hypothetical protein CWR41_00300 [Cedecea lapagei]